MSYAGGAKNLNYQSLAKDLTAATLEIPFTIPPYFALIARALGTTTTAPVRYNRYTDSQS